MKLRYSGIEYNDVVNGIGVCVSLFVQGCPHHCHGCFNIETWDFNGGQVIEDTEFKGHIIQAISENGIQRNFSVLGGEPMCPENIKFVDNIITAVRTAYPNIIIHLWTGYTFKELKKMSRKEPLVNSILEKINYLIDGPFIEEKKDLTLLWRGSTNQHIYKNNNGKFDKIKNL